jgi:hypothetical protein
MLQQAKWDVSPSQSGQSQDAELGRASAPYARPAHLALLVMQIARWRKAARREEQAVAWYDHPGVSRGL